MAIKYYAIASADQPGYEATYLNISDYVLAEAADLVGLADSHVVVLISQVIYEYLPSDFSGFTTNANFNITIIPDTPFFNHDYQESNMIRIFGSVNDALFLCGNEYVHLEGFIIENSRSQIPIQNSTTVMGPNVSLHRMILKASKPINEANPATTTMQITASILMPIDTDNSALTTFYKGDRFTNNMVYRTLDMESQAGITPVTDNFAEIWTDTLGGIYAFCAGMVAPPGPIPILVVDESLVFVAGSMYQAQATGDHRLVDSVTNPLVGTGTGGSNIGPAEAYLVENHDVEGAISECNYMACTLHKIEEEHYTRDGVLSSPVATSATYEDYQSEDHTNSGIISVEQSTEATTYRFDERYTTGDPSISVPVSTLATYQDFQNGVVAGRIGHVENMEGTAEAKQTVYGEGTISVPHETEGFALQSEDHDFLRSGTIYEVAFSEGVATQIPLQDSDHIAVGEISEENSTYSTLTIDTDGYNDLGEAICLVAHWNADIDLDGEMNTCQC